MRGWAALLLFAAAACRTGPHEADVVAVEVKAPVNARLMVREHEEAASCSGTTGIVERLSCIFQTTMTTCAWVEIESPELAAHPMGKDLAACQSLGSTGPRVVVPGSGTDYRLEVDPGGERIAFSRGGPSASVAYVLGGVVVGQLPADWATVWKDSHRLEDVLGGFFASSDSVTSDRMLAYAKTKGGEKAVLSLMVAMSQQSVDRWSTLYEGLQDEGLKREALAALHEQLAGPVASQIISDLIAYPELQPKNFTAILAASAEQAVTENADWYSVSPLLEELQRRKQPMASELACRIYGMQLLASMPARGYEYDEVEDPEAAAGALLIIGQQKAPCPWLAIALEKDPCSDAHRCLSDGGIPDPDGEDLMYDEETGEPVLSARPLCSRKVALTALRRGVAAEDDEEYEDLPLGGPLLLAAAYAHDAVPKDVLLRNARRMYRFEYPPPAPPTPEQVEYGETNEVPCQRPKDLSSAVCHLPLDVTEVSFNGCRLRIDDKAHVVRVELLKPK